MSRPKEQFNRFVETDVIFRESGMNFVANLAFPIERYHNSQKLDGVKKTEFLLFREDAFIFIEAKSSFSDSGASNFCEQAARVRDKFIHSLELFSSLEIGVRLTKSTTNFPKSTIKRKVLFLLVIKKLKKDNEGRIIREKIAGEIPRHLTKIWDMKVLILNKEEAIRQGYVKKDTTTS